jgi:prepilin peptidase CpaA
MQNEAVASISGQYGAPVAGVCVLAFLALAIAGIYQDVRIRRIPNTLSLALFIGGGIFFLLADPVWPGVRSAVSGLAVGFGIWIAFYAIGVMGAGDVKYFAALSSWLGPSLSWRAALLSAMIGGVLAVVFLLRDRGLTRALRTFALLPFLRSLSAAQVVDMSDDEAQRQLPYGVALGVGAILAFLFPHVLGTVTR